MRYNDDPQRIFDYGINNYRGVRIVEVPSWVPLFGENAAMFPGRSIHIGSNIGVNPDNRDRDINIVLHEWGHFVQRQMITRREYREGIAMPSLWNSLTGTPHRTATNTDGYYLQLWEITADILGGVPRNSWWYDGEPMPRTIEAELGGLKFLFKLIEISNMNYFTRGNALNELFARGEIALLQRVNEFTLPGTRSMEATFNQSR